MKFCFEAIQAVTIEFCGVLLVVGTLFGLGSIGLRTAGVGETQFPTVIGQQPAATVARAVPSAEDSAGYTADPLDYFSLVVHK